VLCAILSGFREHFLGESHGLSQVTVAEIARCLVGICVGEVDHDLLPFFLSARALSFSMRRASDLIMLAAMTMTIRGVARIRPTISRLLIGLQVVWGWELLFEEHLDVSDHRQKGDEYDGSYEPVY